MKTLAVLCAIWSALAAVSRGQDALDRLSDALTLSILHDDVRVHLSGLVDAEGYYFERPAPGLIDTVN